MRPPTHPTVKDDAERFDAALSRLEAALAASVQKLASMAHSAGFEDGLAHAKAHARGLANDSSPDEAARLVMELEAARAREHNLQEAVTAARVALEEAMDEIRGVLGAL